MKKIILLTALLINAALAGAQVALYSFTQSSGTYTQINGGTQLIDGSADMNNKISAAVTIPAFVFNGVTYTTAYVTSNGILTLGSTAPASNATTGISAGTGSGICICPFSGNLDRINNDGNAEARYQQVGTELVFQWKSLRRKTENEGFDFQARLNTANGVIKFVYNLISGPSPSTSFPEVGIRTSATDYNNRRVGTGAENWATSLAGTANTNTMRFTNNSPAKSFADGLTYTFTPPGQCSASPAGGTAAATATTGVCPAGSNLSLSGNTSGYGISYQWQSSPDGSSWSDISGASAASYSLASVLATTQYRCNVTCYNSGLTTASVPVTVTRSGPAVPTFISNASVCAGSLPATLSVTAVSGCTVDWYNAASGGTLLLSGNASYSASSAGTYYAESRNTTSSCPSASRTAVTLTVNPIVAPSVSIVQSVPGSICAGTSVTFTATPANGGAAPVYQWKLNNANVGNNSITYANSSLTDGSNIKCVMTSNASCISAVTATSNAITMTVNAIVVPSVSMTASPSGAICSGSTVTFTASAANGGTPTYQWKRNGSNVGVGTSTYVNSNLANNDVIYCIMTSSATCVSAATATSNSLTMSVNALLTPSVSISASPSGAICSGTPVTFSAVPVNGGTPVYQWKRNGSNVGSNSSTYSSSALTNSDQIICVMASNVTCASAVTATSNTAIMTVNANVTPSVTISSNAGAFCMNSVIVYTASPSDGGSSPVYQWKINGTNSGNSAPTFSFRPLNGDIVTCVMTSNASCAAIVTATSNAVTATLVAPSAVGLASGDMVWTGSTNSDWTNTTNWLVFSGGTNFTTASSSPTPSDNVIIKNNGTCFSTVPDVPGLQTCRSLTITAGNSLTMVGTASLEIYGDWLNYGLFNAGSSTITFRGAQPQQIASGGNQFHNITFNNTSSSLKSINISEPLQVTGTAAFTNGVVYFTGTGSLSFADNTATNSGNANSFVAGPVTKTGNDAFVFPVGKISATNTKIWAPLSITNPTALTDVFTCEYFYAASYNNTDPSSMCDYSQLKNTSGTEYWDLHRSVGTSTPQVTLYWDDAIRSGINDPSDLVVAHLEDCGGTPKWKAMTTVLNGISGSTGSVTGSGFTSYSPITFGSKNGSNPLPVELLDFSADCDNGTVDLSWATATETNNDYFSIERSKDAENWQLAGTVKGAGNSNQKIAYLFTDAKSDAGTFYYRLKQTDFDGKSEYFGPVKVNCSTYDKFATVTYYPNPFIDNITVKMAGVGAGRASIAIYDILGNKVAAWEIGSDELQRQNYMLRTTDLPEGVYFIEFVSDGYTGTSKLVKK